MRSRTIKYKTKICVVCHEKFKCQTTHRRTKRCQKCQSLFEKSSAKTRRTTHRLLKKSGIKTDVCQECGSRNMVETHHKTPINKGGGPELSNVKILCYKCHQKAHGWFYKHL